MKQLKHRIFVFLALAGVLCPPTAMGQTLEELEQRDKDKIAAASWIPADPVAMDKFQGKDFRIFVYQYRIEFYSKDAKKPSITLSFKHPVNVSPPSVYWESGSNIFACTNRFQEYSVQDPQEQRMAFALGHMQNQMKWENSKAQFSEFCGVIGTDGKVIFQFPKEVLPGTLYYPVGMTKDGKRAAIMVGSYGKIENPDEDAENDQGLNFREVWVWEYPKTVRKKRMTQKEMNGNLLQELRDGRL